MAKNTSPKPKNNKPVRQRSKPERAFWLFVAVVVGLGFLMLCTALLAGALNHAIK